MTRRFLTFATLAIATTSFALASSASTSATAGYNRYAGGNAAATASYTGEQGFARTDTKTGRVNIARGVALGVDENGVSLSLSNAVATQNGPAVSTTFNLSIGAAGNSAMSVGAAAATGGTAREATSGGSTYAQRYRSGATAVSTGRTSGTGRVVAITKSRDYRRPRVAPQLLARGVTFGYRR